MDGKSEGKSSECYEIEATSLEEVVTYDMIQE